MDSFGSISREGKSMFLKRSVRIATVSPNTKRLGFTYVAHQAWCTIVWIRSKDDDIERGTKQAGRAGIDILARVESPGISRDF